MAKNSKINDEKSSKVVLIAQELKQARILAGNDKNLRDKTLKKLRKWLTFRSQSSTPFTAADFMRLWKGLYYCMWMSDKPLIQEECAEMISQLVHCFPDTNQALLFTKCFLQTMCNEWFGIDIFRLDKFYMLIRRMLRQILHVLKKGNWDSDFIEQFDSILSETVLNGQTPNILGLKLHVIEIYLEELAKVSKGKLEKPTVTELLKPFIQALATAADSRVGNHLKKHVFNHLLYQSNEGIEFQEKFNAWKNFGFPGGSIDGMQKVSTNESDSEDSENETNKESDNVKDNEPLDPRAGKVDVVLPQIPFDPKQIADLFQLYKHDKNTTSKSRKVIQSISDNYDKMAQGIFPLGLKRVKLPSEEDTIRTKIDEAAENLFKFEEQLHDKKLTKSEKRKLKRSLAEKEENEGDSIVETLPKMKRRKIQKTDEDGDFESKYKKFVEASESGLDLNLSENSDESKISIDVQGGKRKKIVKKTKQINQKEETEVILKGNKKKRKLNSSIEELAEVSNKKKRKQADTSISDLDELSGEQTFIGLSPTSGVWLVEDVTKVTKTDGQAVKAKRKSINKTPVSETAVKETKVNNVMSKTKSLSPLKEKNNNKSSQNSEKTPELQPKNSKNSKKDVKIISSIVKNKIKVSPSKKDVKNNSVDTKSESGTSPTKVKVSKKLGKNEKIIASPKNKVRNPFNKMNADSSKKECKKLNLLKKSESEKSVSNTIKSPKKISETKKKDKIVSEENKVRNPFNKMNADSSKKVCKKINLLKKSESEKSVSNAIKSPKKISENKKDKIVSEENCTTPEGSGDKLKSKRILFQQSEWDCPLQEGETEIFIPSKKYKMKLEKNASNAILKENKTKKSQSLLVNPFAKTSKTPPSMDVSANSLEKNGAKKVKIVLKHNMAQETSEYYRQVKNSPALPYDASKKPTKSLLKSSTPSPINPFYKLRSSFT